MDNNIENKKSDVNSSDNFEKINWIVKNADETIKKIGDSINLKGSVDLHVSDDCVAQILRSDIYDRTLSGNTIKISREILFEKYSLNGLIKNAKIDRHKICIM